MAISIVAATITNNTKQVFELVNDYDEAIYIDQEAITPIVNLLIDARNISASEFMKLLDKIKSGNR